MLRRKKKYLAAGLTCVVLLVAAGCSSRAAVDELDHRPGQDRVERVQDVHRRGADRATGPGHRNRPRRSTESRRESGSPPPRGTRSSTSSADTATTTTGASPGRRRWCEQDHVFAVHRALGPDVLGRALPHAQQDPGGRGRLRRSEWLLPKSYNMFSVIGNLDFTKVYTTTGLFLKSQERHQPRVGGLLDLPELGGGGQGGGRLS